MPKFYCEYCNIYLTHSSPAGRKQHSQGKKHINAKIEYYQNLIRERGFQPPSTFGMAPPFGIPPGIPTPPPPFGLNGMPLMHMNIPPGIRPPGLPFNVPPGFPPIPPGAIPNISQNVQPNSIPPGFVPNIPPVFPNGMIPPPFPGMVQPPPGQNCIPPKPPES